MRCVGLIDRQELHSFPTRRSSDLGAVRAGADCPRVGFAAENEVEAGQEHRLSRPGLPGNRCEPGSEVDPCLKEDRKSTRLNSSHVAISYAVFCLKKKKIQINMVVD